MLDIVRCIATVITVSALAPVSACGGDPVPISQPASESAEAREASPAETPAAETEIAAESTTATAASDSGEEAADDEEVIDPDELEPSGQIELKQYTVAWVGSGTMGGGTLIVDGKGYPFRLAGLGIGGYGASSIDAHGTVYNLPSLEAFPGTYGNARLGMTGGDSGGGKLWLRNPDGVVIELVSEMRGLALAGGVDGILIQWDEEEDGNVDRAMDSTREAAGDAIEAGADAVQDGVDNVKGWFKKKD